MGLSDSDWLKIKCNNSIGRGGGFINNLIGGHHNKFDWGCWGDKFDWEGFKVEKMKISSHPTNPTFKRQTKQNAHLYYVFIVSQPVIIQFLTR